MDFYDDPIDDSLSREHAQLVTLLGSTSLLGRDKTCISCSEKKYCYAFPSRVKVIEITFQFGLLERLKEFLIDTLSNKGRWDFQEADDEYVERKQSEFKNIIKKIEKPQKVDEYHNKIFLSRDEIPSLIHELTSEAIWCFITRTLTKLACVEQILENAEYDSTDDKCCSCAAGNKDDTY